jgi:phosphatidylglycerophosphate synthase
MKRTALIIAPDMTGLQPVFGVPAVRRLVILTKRLGFESTHLMGKVEKLAPLLSDLMPGQFLHSVEDEGSLDDTVGKLHLPDGEKVLVLKAGHVIDRRSLAQFLDSGRDETACLMKLQEATPSDGIFLVSPDYLSAILPAIWSSNSQGSTLPEGIKVVHSVTGFPHVIHGQADTTTAEGKLVAALAAHTKADDGFIARHFDRRISERISRKLSHTSIMPNHITLVGMSMGLVAAFLLSRTGYWLPLLGSFLFVLCVIVDGVDGEVARLTLKESAFGHYLDVVTDNIVHAAIFVGIAFGLYHDTGNRAYLWVLWLMLGGFGLCIIAVYQFILKLSPEEMDRSPMTLRAMALLSNRDFAYLIAMLALFGRLNWFLIGASLGSYLFAVALWVISAREKQNRASPARQKPVGG